MRDVTVAAERLVLAGSDCFSRNSSGIRLGAPELQEARDRRDGGMSFVDTLDEPVRFTQGKNIGVKRGRL
jgi:hypothetical protein